MGTTTTKTDTANAVDIGIGRALCKNLELAMSSLHTLLGPHGLTPGEEDNIRELWVHLCED